MTELVHQHGVKGVWHGGEWLDLEHCDGVFTNIDKKCSGCDMEEACPRSRSRSYAAKEGSTRSHQFYDVVIVGAGCVGAAVARELAKYQAATGPLSVLWVEAADDVSQGATKGNSGIVHAGYDDKPGSNRAKFCWKGNQMFADLDRELRFGYQKNGSLVVAFNDKERAELEKLMRRGESNGVKRLRIVEKEELFKMEPHLNPDAICALYSPDAGNVIPYEYAIALAENACDNGIELRIRTAVVGIEQVKKDGYNFRLSLQSWEPEEYIQAVKTEGKSYNLKMSLNIVAFFVFAHYMAVKSGMPSAYSDTRNHMGVLVICYILTKFENRFFPVGMKAHITKSTPLEQLYNKAGEPLGKPTDPRAEIGVTDMLMGGSGSADVWKGQKVDECIVSARNVINCAGGAADIISRMIGDKSFEIKPRIGDYLLLKKNQGHLANHTIFPCPDPKLGKGVLVQTTLWGNLILGPTARDMDDPKNKDMSPEEIQTYILSKCKKLVPEFDPKMTIHAFAGARAKSTRGDWIIEPSKVNPHFLQVAGIDSPGLAGSPAIALEVVKMLQKDGLHLKPNPHFKKDRAPIIIPKDGLKGLKMGPIGKNDSDGSNMEQMASNVICKCEKVTELEVVRALRRSLPVDSSQGIRKRTRAGMGSCQAKCGPDNYNCEARVRAIIARETQVPVQQIGKRPWPATSTLSQRWIDDEERATLEKRKLVAA